jgi:hypothetical protein
MTIDHKMKLQNGFNLVAYHAIPAGVDHLIGLRKEGTLINSINARTFDRS